MSYFNSSSDYVSELLKEIGLSSLAELFKDIPEELLLKEDLKLSKEMAEWELLSYFQELSTKNQYQTNNFKGAGVYQHHVPALVKYLSNRGEFLTAYTPYQAEVSQGTLRAIYMFQSFIADICGMKVANASMYDGATALAESLCMAHRLHKNRKIYLSKSTHPEYIAVCKSYLEALDIQLDFFDELSEVENESIIAIQTPNFHGQLLDKAQREALTGEIQQRNLFLIVATNEPFALFLQDKLNHLGAEIVCGSAQAFGNPVFYGGAQVGFIASKLEHIRQMPGRIIGKTTDRQGKTGYVLTFQAREQHIKRERAGSNICTNQSLHALCVSIYLSLMGLNGIQKIIQDIYKKSLLLRHTLKEFPALKVSSNNCFNEFLISINFHEIEKDFGNVIRHKLEEHLNSHLVNLERFTAAIPDENLTIKESHENYKSQYLLAITESNSHEMIQEFLDVLNTLFNKSIIFNVNDKSSLDEALRAENNFLKEVLEDDFLLHRSTKFKFKSSTELDVCRYFTKLSQKNFSIDSNFYPLGSCTMKYNPKINDEIASQSSWTQVHPYENPENIQGVLKIYQELNKALCEITGFHEFSLQPAAGAQGEFAALLMAKKYFSEKGMPKRNIVLIPDSAHGTNPASASMAGFKVITVRSSNDGDIDLEHLNQLCEKHSRDLAVFMLTNPNTLGIFSKKIIKITETIHQHQGLMYYDGANLNAIVGICRPGDMGFDLIHLNLHKTFSTPHGGGGPGAGPVGAKGELIEYLPSPALRSKKNTISKDSIVNEYTASNEALYWDYGNPKSIGRIRAFHGNFNVLIRALAYIKSNGKEGISQIGKIASLNANYLQEKIRKSPILSKENILSPYFNQLCKHEFIISGGKLKEKLGITALDLAKSLLDKGIHAPTIYFPLIIDECIMIEPTETESKENLDKLVQALEEIISLAETESGREQIKTAPHSTPLSRFDEVKAVKEPILSWVMES